MSARVIAIIQARMTSMRLHGKILLPVRADGTPMLAEVIARARAMKTIDVVTVAFPRGDLDYQQCIDVANEAGVPYWPVSGLPPRDLPDESDVLSRYVRAANEYAADVIVRITADCPLFDAALGDAVVTAGRDWSTYDYVRGRKACEAFPIDVLMRAHRRAIESDDREHVTRWIYSANVAGNTCAYIDDERPNWSVNTQADLDRVRDILAKNPAATWTWND